MSVPFPRLWNFNFSCLLRFVPYNWVPLLCYCHFKELATVFLWCESFNFRFPLFKSRYATLHPAMLVGRSVGRSVSWSVGLSVGWSVGPLLYFWAFLSFLRLLLLPRCPCNLLQQCSCLPTCDWSSRVSGLVFSRGHATLHLAVSVGPSVGPSHFQIASGFRTTAPAQPSATGLPCIQPCY